MNVQAISTPWNPLRPRVGRPRGFTLVELLLVVTIVSVLLILLLPSLGAARDVANSGACQSNLRSLNQGCFTYSTDHNQYIIPGLSRVANLAANICWYDNPNSASGSVVSGLYHEGLLGSYVPSPTGKTNSAYGCPGDSYYPTTANRRITYNYSYNIQSFAVADPPYYVNDKPYYWTGPLAYLSTATGSGFNKLSLIKNEPSQVGVLADGFYTATTPGGAYNIGLGGGTYNQTYNLTCYQATASDPTLVPLGNFADPLGSTTVQTGTRIFYSAFHPNKSTNIAFLDGHAGPMTWEDVKAKYTEKSGYSYPFAFN